MKIKMAVLLIMNFKSTGSWNSVWGD